MRASRMWGPAARTYAVPAAQVIAEEAAGRLARALQCGACVDEHLQDQLILFMALAAGTSRVR